MKTIIKLLLLIVTAFSLHAQNVQYRPTGYTAPFVSTINSAAAAQSYLGVSASTNTPTLNGPNTFTGTNSFPAAGLFPGNGIMFRVLYSMPTNRFFATIATNATTATLTNNGNFTACTSLLDVTLPALLGSNSIVLAAWNTESTNLNSAICDYAVYAGINTNFFMHNTGFRVTTIATTFALFNVNQILFANANSFTNQTVNRQVGTVTVPGITSWGRTNIVNTSVPWPFKFGLTTITSHSNLHVTSFTVYEIVKN